MGFEGRKQSKMFQCMKGPIRTLARARDLYFQNMSCSGVHVFSGSAMGCPNPQLGSLSRNTGVSSSGSSRGRSSDGYSRRSSPMVRRTRAAPVPRTHSVPICRIDEDSCCHFGIDDEPEVVYPKSRSCAAARRSTRVDDFKMDAKYPRI